MKDPRGKGSIRLVSTSFGGNVHAAANAINRLGLSSYVIFMECGCPDYTNAVFRTYTEEEWQFLKSLFNQTGEF